MNTLIKFLILFTLFGCEPAQEFTGSEENDMAQRKRDWAQSGDLRTGQQGMGISLQTAFGELGVHTVQFFMKTPKAVANLRIRARAEIEWSVNGNTVLRQIHVADGSAITGAAESVVVRVFDDSQWFGAPGAAPTQSYVGTIMVSPGTRASIFPPIFEGNRVVIANGGNSDEVIPDNIGVQSFQIETDAMQSEALGPLGTLLADQRDTAAVRLAITDPRRFQWNTMMPGARILRLANNTGGQIVCKVVYGIEG